MQRQPIAATWGRSDLASPGACSRSGEGGVTRSKLAMVGLGRSEDLYDLGQQPFSPRAHVNGLHGQPHGIDADHRSHCLSQAAQSLAASSGQATLHAPQCPSIYPVSPLDLPPVGA